VSAGAEPGDERPAFSPGVILALVLVGVLSFAGLVVLSAYAPELRGKADRGAHALSTSAVGYQGAVQLSLELGLPIRVSRDGSGAPLDAELLVLTPPLGRSSEDMKHFRAGFRTLIVLPKWAAEPDPMRPARVRKAGLLALAPVSDMLGPYAPKTSVQRRPGASSPALRGVGDLFPPGAFPPLGPIDRLQTMKGEGWEPVLVDEQGEIVLGRSRRLKYVYVLAEPDLLNNQGIARLETARAGVGILERLSGQDGAAFDVTLNGFQSGRSIGRVLLQPPWLAATLCGVAAALLMGLHALARFGPARRSGRALPPGRQVLVDSSAGLVRMAGKEHELAPAYAELARSQILRAAGAERANRPQEETDAWLEDLARQRGAAPAAPLVAEAATARSREDLLNVGRKLYQWRLEMTRGRD